jgi:hypothetical protein
MNIFQKILKSIFGKPRVNKLVIIDPERLHHVNKDKARSKNYRRYKKTYYYGASRADLVEAQNQFRQRGRYIKCWKLVTSAFDAYMDEYVPIFHKKK